MTLLKEITARLSELPPDQYKQIEEEVITATAGRKFIPSPGPQLAAYNSKADILLYGGEPGGGKTGLLIGLALEEHERSLIVRKQFTDVDGVVDNAKSIVGDEGFVGGMRPKYTKAGDAGVIHFRGMSQGEGVDTGKQGTPYDFIGVDEGAQLPENSVRALKGWNRTKKPGQRCRMVIASNPPLDSTGDWMIEFFGPWLDHRHERPAKDGELRWFIIGPNDKSMEVEGPSDIRIIEGKEYVPHSRTFIRASVDDNPFLDGPEYRRSLQVMPEPYRSILMSGNFMYARKDQDNQLMPTAWVREAQARWTPQPLAGIPMCAMGVDPNGGGEDSFVIAYRHDGWYGPAIVVEGKDVPNGDGSGQVIHHRRDLAEIVLDMGGGYGGATYQRLTDNKIEVIAYKGSESSAARTNDKKLGFFNKRSEAYWRFREALDPSQQHGSSIALPDDPKLVAELTAPTFSITSRGIQVEPKADVKDKLGRSPDRADAFILAWASGEKAISHGSIWKDKGPHKGQRPKVQLGYSNRKR